LLRSLKFGEGYGDRLSLDLDPVLSGSFQDKSRVFNGKQLDKYELSELTAAASILIFYHPDVLDLRIL
jgi:hypothetical protein